MPYIPQTLGQEINLLNYSSGPQMTSYSCHKTAWFSGFSHNKIEKIKIILNLYLFLKLKILWSEGANITRWKHSESNEE